MHKIQERPMVVGGQIVIRPMMYLALLRSPHRRRQGSGDLPGPRQGSLEDPQRAAAGVHGLDDLAGVLDLLGARHLGQFRGGGPPV
jgi:hypothetical protein